MSVHAPRFRPPALLGIAIGLLAGALALALIGQRRGIVVRRPPTGPLISECDGALDTIVIQYVPEADFVVPVYRQFLGQLPAGITVRVMCPDDAAYRSLLAQVGNVRCTLVPVLTDHAMTTWSRDRWLALRPYAPGGAAVLLSPRGEAGSEVWPARAGDQRVADDLAKADPAHVDSRKSELYFDGGDFTTDGATIFVTPAVLRRNLQRTVNNRDELQATLAAALKGNVVLLDEAPDHHAGMFMMVVGQRTVLVGDPAAGKRAMGTTPLPPLPDGADFSEAMQHAFDAVAAQVAAAGYRVVRIPTIPANDGKSYLTYVNVIIDHCDGTKIVYMPVYQGAEPLNAAATQVWEELGYQVRTIDCTGTYRRFGCLHCLVNVISREPGGDEPSKTASAAAR